MDKKIAQILTDTADAYAYGISTGMNQQTMYETTRDGLIDAGWPAEAAASMVRLVIEIASRRALGESHYGDEAVPVLIDKALG